MGIADKNEQHFSNEKGNHDLENEEEDKPLRKKRHKREKRKSRRGVLQNLNFPEPPANLLENYHDLDLSVEFLSQVFKYVDELCEYINNGDENLDRSSVVIQNLNYAVSCYRVNLTEQPKPDIQEEDFQEEDQEDFKYEIDPPVDFHSNDEDEEYKEPKPKKKEVKKKTAERKSEIKEETNGNDDTFEDETGKSKKRKWERKGKPVVEIEIEKLLSFMNMTENKFSCKFCDQTYNTGPHFRF